MKRLVQLFTCLLVTTVLITASVYASTIATPKVIIGGGGTPNIAVVGENIFVASGVLFTRSTDQGNNFSTPTNISGGIGIGEASVLAAVGTNVYVAWPGVTNPSFGIDGVYLVKSTDSGSTFSSPVRISGFQPDAINVDVGASGSSVYVSWVDANQQIAFIRSMDGERFFSAPIILSTPSVPEADVPSIAATGRFVYVAWIENPEPDVRLVLVAGSSDFGMTFSSPAIIPGAARADVPSIVTNKKGDKIFIAYREDESDPIRSIEFARSEDGGLTFTTPVSVSLGFVDRPSLAINNRGDLNLAWVQNDDILFSRSTDLGNTFSIPENVSNDVSQSNTSSLDMNNMGKGFATWTDSSITGSNILFTTTTP